MPGGQILTTGFYLFVFLALSRITRPPALRIIGAVTGGVIAGVVALLALLVGEAHGWWRVPNGGLPHFRSLFWLSFAVSCTPVYLITWRVARWMGSRGLALCVAAAAIIGPPRDYAFAALFPAWIVFSQGVTPVLAVAVVYALLLVSGHAAMRIVAGPDNKEILARRL